MLSGNPKIIGSMPLLVGTLQFGHHGFSAFSERTLLLVRENQDQLRIIVQGVINALFAGRRIRCAPIVKKVVADGSDNFRIHLDDNRVSAISVTVEAEEFFAEAVRKAVLRRLASSRQIPGSYRH